MKDYMFIFTARARLRRGVSAVRHIPGRLTAYFTFLHQSRYSVEVIFTERGNSRRNCGCLPLFFLHKYFFTQKTVHIFTKAQVPPTVADKILMYKITALHGLINPTSSFGLSRPPVARRITNKAQEQS